MRACKRVRKSVKKKAIVEMIEREKASEKNPSTRDAR